MGRGRFKNQGPPWTGISPPLGCWGSGGMAQPVGPLFGTRWPNRGPGSRSRAYVSGPSAGWWPKMALMTQVSSCSSKYGSYGDRPGRCGPVKRAKKMGGYRSTNGSSHYRGGLLTENQTGHMLVLDGRLRRWYGRPAPWGPRGTSVRVREHEDGPAATSRGSRRLAEYRERRAMSSCRPYRGRKAGGACRLCSRH